MSLRTLSIFGLFGLFLLTVSASRLSAAEGSGLAAAPVLERYCFQCHSTKVAMGGISLEKLAGGNSVGENFGEWQKVVAALEENRMPPRNMPQPAAAERAGAITSIRAELGRYAAKYAGDPGRVTLRRLTSAEYGYTMEDLTGLDIDVENDFVPDQVGGEGFTNYGDAQFMQDANLERYLESAKRIANHAVIGAGPIEFFRDPGKSGLELSAVSRIQEIYRANGFRAASGEGGKPYGLERYTKAFYAAWQYRHRKVLGEPKATLASLARKQDLNPKFVQHIWDVLHDTTPTYPALEAVTKWRGLPVPTRATAKQSSAKAQEGCEDIRKFLIYWPRWLFAAGAEANGGAGDERALLLTDASVQAELKGKMRFAERTRRGESAKIHLWVVPVNPGAKGKTSVIWRDPVVRFRGKEKGEAAAVPLRQMLAPEVAQRLAFGENPGGAPIGENDFVTSGDFAMTLELATPKDAGGFSLAVDPEIAFDGPHDAILRCTVSQSEDLGKGRPGWALLGDPQSPEFRTWKTDVLEFAGRFPQITHGEPTPSDKDDIPPPYNNDYNQPERDYFHYKVKYYRDDDFLVKYMIDEADRIRLDQAWTDLRASFEFHDANLRFVADKFKVDLKGKTIHDLTEADIAALPAGPAPYVKSLRDDYLAVQKTELEAQPGHIEDCVRFAGQAWRRPLSESEKGQLRAFYRNAREKMELDHAKAIRALIARILVAPAFLYRLEEPTELAAAAPLSNWEMANRLSYFLWSSAPDKELRRAAAAGDLTNPKQLERQARRMLADPKARRLATEFFGQWLGFYRFNQHRGVDTGRFPEFTDEVKSAMYEEAVGFFEHIVREDRPVREMLTADYTYLNKALAKHYGVEKGVEGEQPQLVAGIPGRGGMLRLGAVLAVTSAPLRTSPVKRGDWVLRRVLGTPTPPPPPNAGSIPADPKAFGGMTVKQRLATHRTNATCANCHNRIDPLGFAFEHYDPVGRWRDQYSEGQTIEDSGKLSDDTEIAGVEGLLNYLKTKDKQVWRNFSAKLLGYALGRTVLPSDEVLIDKLTAQGGATPFSDLVANVVTSPQFRRRRGQQEQPPEPVTLSQNRPVLRDSEKEGE